MVSFEIITSRTGEKRFNFERVNVLLGSNGTGKSKLLQELQKRCDTFLAGYTPVRIEGGRAVQMVDSLELNNRNYGEFKTFDQILSGFRQKRTQTLTSRLFHGLKALEQRGVDSKIAHSDAIVQWENSGGLAKRPPPPTDPMIRVFEIFNDIFPTIKLRYRRSDNRLLCTKRASEYGPTGLSDGEKQVFSILVDVIELTDEKSVLFVDEPELNLNPGLANRLWTSIESLLPRAVFIYATHSVNFALRESVQKLLVLSNSDDSIQEIDGLNELSYSDQKDLLGNIPSLIAHKNALVVEGYDESFDVVFYRWLLEGESFLPSPVGGSEDVAAMATRSGKWEKISPEISITGVIDRDYKSDKEVAQLKEKGLIVLDLHEAESYLCDPYLLHSLIQKLGTLEPIPTRIEIESKLFEYIDRNLFAICAKRANARLSLSIRPSMSSKSLQKINNYDDLERVFVADVSKQIERAQLVLDVKNVKSILKEEQTRLKELNNTKNVNIALQLLPAKELLKEFSVWFKLTDTNSLARAVRKHLEVRDFPFLVKLQTKLNQSMCRSALLETADETIEN